MLAAGWGGWGGRGWCTAGGGRRRAEAVGAGGLCPLNGNCHAALPAFELWLSNLYILTRVATPACIAEADRRRRQPGRNQRPRVEAGRSFGGTGRRLLRCWAAWSEVCSVRWRPSKPLTMPPSIAEG